MRPDRGTAQATAYVAAILDAPSYEDVQRAAVARARATFGPGYITSAELRAEAEAVFGASDDR